MRRDASIPSADRWGARRRRLAAASPALGALVLLAAAGALDAALPLPPPLPAPPLWAVALALGGGAGGALLRHMSDAAPPSWHGALVAWAFVVTIGWLNLIASELVAALEAIGRALGVSTALLGLTARPHFRRRADDSVFQPIRLASRDALGRQSSDGRRLSRTVRTSGKTRACVVAGWRRVACANVAARGVGRRAREIVRTVRTSDKTRACVVAGWRRVARANVAARGVGRRTRAIVRTVRTSDKTRACVVAGWWRVARANVAARDVGRRARAIVRTVRTSDKTRACVVVG